MEPLLRKRVAFGRAILEARARRGLSQETLGFAAHIHRNQVGAIERAEGNPTFSTVIRLTTGLNMPLSELAALAERHEREMPMATRRPWRRR